MRCSAVSAIPSKQKRSPLTQRSTPLHRHAVTQMTQPNLQHQSQESTKSKPSELPSTWKYCTLQAFCRGCAEVAQGLEAKPCAVFVVSGGHCQSCPAKPCDVSARGHAGTSARALLWAGAGAADLRFSSALQQRASSSTWKCEFCP